MTSAMTSNEETMRPKGFVRLYGRRELIWEGQNLFVNAGLPALANLIAGVTTGQFVTAIGFGSGPASPTVTDTALTANPAYYNAIVSHSFPSSGSVQFNYALAPADYGALGITIQELGLLPMQELLHCQQRSEPAIPHGVPRLRRPWARL
jgi:hypothetical protein